MRALIIAPHPDDEILGCGGTIARLVSEGNEVFVVVVTKAGPPLYDENFLKQSRKESLLAHELLGVKQTFYLDFPAAGLDKISHGNLNSELTKIINELNTDILFIPFVGDIHLDHQYVYLSSLVASRPNQAVFPKKILAYETLSETNWNAPYLCPHFQPNVFFNISKYLSKKLKAFECYESQRKEFPHERSTIALEALAKLRGAAVFCNAAEAFVLIREVIDNDSKA